jgi:eukaryotic-like serine/threonine-protein kinase
MCRLLMELCNGTLTDLVRRAQAERNLPGLPPVDTVALGMMLVDAITAVHRRACSAHLDIKPDNVLLAAPKAGAAADALRSVRLSDFGLSKRLPSCVMTSVVTKAAPSVIGGAGGGTAGYAPLEQMDKKGRRASDVYSMGATLLFAATCNHPFGNDSTYEQIIFSLLRGAPSRH